MRLISSKTELDRLFSMIDESLRTSIEMYVIGGANLIAQGLAPRETHDVDVISPPKFSEEVKALIKEVAAREDLDPHWLNTMPSRDERFLADGWRERATVFFNGQRIRVWLVSRKDMVGLKLAAALDRRVPDEQDLLAMNPTEEEWEFGRLWAREYDANPDWPEAIDQVVLKIKGKQRG